MVVWLTCGGVKEGEEGGGDKTPTKEGDKSNHRGVQYKTIKNGAWKSWRLCEGTHKPS